MRYFYAKEYLESIETLYRFEKAKDRRQWIQGIPEHYRPIWIKPSSRYAITARDAKRVLGKTNGTWIYFTGSYAVTKTLTGEQWIPRLEQGED